MSEPAIPTLRLFNTLSGQLEEFQPQETGKVKMYVCGPTVYDEAHLGHARCYITWDVLYRFLKFLGYDVTYVRNVTDVDDKILNRAKELGLTPATVAEQNYRSFTADMRALNTLPPDKEPRATEYIEEMQRGIQALIDNGHAYATPDGSVYFRVSKDADYGKLSKKPLDDLKAGARVEVDTSKENPLDFALWKAVPSSDANAWYSPWPPKGQDKGWGRPGWHMECSAMNHAVFGDQIDIHAGGADLIFPHHENEIAQSEAWTGKKPFSKYWLHNGFVNVSGEKMSKSLGNFSTVKKVLERYDANTIRLFLLTNGYRMPVDFNDEALESAKTGAERIGKDILAGLKHLGITREEAKQLLFKNLADSKKESGIDIEERFYLAVEALSKGLNTSEALALLRNLALHIRIWPDLRPDPELYKRENVFYQRRMIQLTLTLFEGVLGFSIDLLFDAQEVPIQLPQDEIRTIYKEMMGKSQEGDKPVESMLSKMVEMRKEAKATKNWGQADAIRKHLTDIGLAVLDNKDGTTSIEKDGQEIVRV